jgi:hypothetical protein
MATMASSWVSKRSPRFSAHCKIANLNRIGTAQAAGKKDRPA